MNKILTLLLLLCCVTYYAQAQIVLSESFDGTTVPTGWTSSQTTGDGWKFSTGAGYDVAATLDHTGNGGNYAWVDFSGTDVGVVLEFPVVNVSTLTVPYLEFYHESHYTGTLSPFNFLYLEAFDGTSWNIINTFQGNTPFGWDKYGFNLTPYVVAGNVQLRFRAESGGSTSDFNNDLLIDDVVIMELPTCPQPSNLNAANVTGTTADLSWVEAGTATDWQIEYGPLGFTQGTGTVVNVTTNPTTLTGLNNSTDYHFYVRSVCAPGDSSFWAGPSTFTTACGVIIAPWIETFAGSSTPNCWTETGPEPYRYTTSAGYGAATAGDYTAGGGTNYAWLDGSTPNNGPGTLTSPFIDVSGLTTPHFCFAVFSNNVDDPENNTLIVEFNDGATWDTLAVFQQNFGTSWAEFSIDLSSYTITGPVQVRFTGDMNSPGTAFYNDLLIDDVRINNGGCPRTCFDPGQLSAINVNFNSADLQWIGNGNLFEVEYGPGGFTQGSGTTSQTTTTTFPLTGLTSRTDYSFYVRNICGGGDTSAWVGPFDFTTPCVSVVGDDVNDAIAIDTLPYLELNYTDSCYSDATGNSSPDVFYQMVIPDCIDSFIVSLCGSNFDTYLRIYAQDGTTQLDFNDDGANCIGGASELAIDVRNNTDYTFGDTIYIVVEGTGTATTGSVIINVTTIESTTRSTISPIGCGSYTSPSGKVWNTAGMYMDTIPNAVGCDSIITINLSIGNDNASTISPLGCDSYTSPSGKIWTVAGTYMDTITNVSGCDSVITINLTMGATTADSITTTACDSYTSPSGKMWTMSGIYMDTIPNASGCDSILTIDLTVNNSSASTISPTVCYSYTSPTGRVWNTSGTYQDTLTNAIGCDSIVTINLTVNDATTDTISPLACDSFVSPSGKLWLSSGNYQDTIPNLAGCDSIITINLTVTNIDPTVNLNGWTLTAVETNADYQWINCNVNNALIFGKNDQSFEPSVDGSYSVMITKNGCMETSSCTNVTGVSISEVKFNSTVTAYPNPTEGLITVELGQVYEDITVRIMTTTGQLVRSQEFATTDKFELAIQEQAGLYIVEIQTKTGERAILKVTKW